MPLFPAHRGMRYLNVDSLLLLVHCPMFLR